MKYVTSHRHVVRKFSFNMNKPKNLISSIQRTRAPKKFILRGKLINIRHYEYVSLGYKTFSIALAVSWPIFRVSLTLKIWLFMIFLMINQLLRSKTEIKSDLARFLAFSALRNGPAGNFIRRLSQFSKNHIPAIFFKNVPISCILKLKGWRISREMFPLNLYKIHFFSSTFGVDVPKYMHSDIMNANQIQFILY